MDNQYFLFIISAFFPFTIGIVWKFTQVSNFAFRLISLFTILFIGMLIVFLGESDPPIKILAFAVLLSGFCVIFSQGESHQNSETCSSSMVTLGLALGVLLGQGFTGRLFLCGLLCNAGFSFIREKNRSFRRTLILAHFIIAFTLSLSFTLGGLTLKMLGGLFLAVTFLPVVPFHLPFVATVKVAKGALSSFWIVVWLAIGLAELNMIYSSLSSEILLFIGLLALLSAFYASLATIGQKQGNLFIASATVAHISLIWGLLNVFPDFSRWGTAFGIAIAFVLGGICLLFSFIRQRYGWQTIGKLPGLASVMPRFGAMMVLFVSFALFLPMFPTFSGLAVMPTVAVADIKLVSVFLIFLAVWLGGGWFFLQTLHQTAFGVARTDVYYTDLKITEITAVALFLLGAGFSGLLY